MTNQVTHTREVWLNNAVAALSQHFYSRTTRYAPNNIRISCGWPSMNAMRIRRRRVAECWDPEASKDGQIEIFISPVLDDPIQVLSSLTHELVHATVGNKEKHGKLFTQFGRSIGLEGKPTCMEAGENMKKDALQPIIAALGTYPHATLDTTAGPTKKQSTRMHKVHCATCGYVARVSTKWLDEVGPPLCVCNKQPMVLG